MMLRKNSPEWWRGKAAALYGAAAIVRAYDNHEIGGLPDTYELGFGAIFIEPVYRMLCGMSLELIFKGILVARNEKIRKTHRLADLAKHAGINTSAATTNYLNFLTHSVTWEGRYPVPLTAEEWLDEGGLHSEISGSGKSKEILERKEAAIGWDAFDRVYKEAEQLLLEQKSRSG